jgi:pentatricopeptide repeat protein
MIILSDKEDQFKPSTPDPHFDVTAPNSNPLVASLPAVVTKTESAFEVSWDQESGPEEPANAGSVLQQISDQAKRDTLRFPGSARAHANFGAALAKAARVDEAVYELEIALSIEPNDYLAGVTLARVYVNNGNYDKARQLYEDLLRYHPKERFNPAKFGIPFPAKWQLCGCGRTSPHRSKAQEIGRVSTFSSRNNATSNWQPSRCGIRPEGSSAYRRS